MFQDVFAGLAQLPEWLTSADQRRRQDQASFHAALRPFGISVVRRGEHGTKVISQEPRVAGMVRKPWRMGAHSHYQSHRVTLQYPL